MQLRGVGCWNIPGAPALNAITAGDGLDGRDRLGSGGIWGHEKGLGRNALVRECAIVRNGESN